MFQISNDAKEWMKDISKHNPDIFGTDMDVYYLFLLVGLIAKKRSSIEDTSTTGFNKEFPKPYKAFQKLIINFLLITEKKYKGIRDDDKDRLSSELIKKYLDPDNVAKLSTKGFTLADEYSYGGFSLLQERIPRPTNVTDFFIAYNKTLKKLAKK
jgi:hypothetical protein